MEAIGLRPAGTVLLTRFERPAGRWAAFGFDDGLRLVERRKNDLFLHRIDLVSGGAATRHVMSVQPLPAARIWNTAIVIGALGAGILLLFLVRPSAEAPALPKGAEPLPLTLRLLAFGIDLAPAGFLVMLLLRNEFLDLFNVPLFTEHLQQSLPYLLMIGFTLVHSMAFECATGRSLGKSLVGAQMTRQDGSRPVLGQLLLRNLIKGLVLLVPPLAVLMLFTPHLQGLQDQATGTLVVLPDAAAPDEQAHRG
jgi:uncharacterized RDD family membrane protein YckC